MTQRTFRDLYTKETVIMVRNPNAIDKAWRQAKESK